MAAAIAVDSITIKLLTGEVESLLAECESTNVDLYPTKVRSQFNQSEDLNIGFSGDLFAITTAKALDFQIFQWGF